MGDTGKARKPRNKNTQEQSKAGENEWEPGSNQPIPEYIKQGMIEETLARIADGEPLRQICREEMKPSWRTFYDWIDADPVLASRFARARELGEEAIAQECLDIANTPLEGIETEESENGIKTKRGDMLGHRKLQIETRLKLLAKWNPKKWGERQTVDMNVTNPVADRLARARKRNAG